MHNFGKLLAVCEEVGDDAHHGLLVSTDLLCGRVGCSRRDSDCDDVHGFHSIGKSVLHVVVALVSDHEVFVVGVEDFHLNSNLVAEEGCVDNVVIEFTVDVLGQERLSSEANFFLGCERAVFSDSEGGVMACWQEVGNSGLVSALQEPISTESGELQALLTGDIGALALLEEKVGVELGLGLAVTLFGIDLGQGSNSGAGNESKSEGSFHWKDLKVWVL